MYFAQRKLTAFNSSKFPTPFGHIEGEIMVASKIRNNELDQI